MRTILSTIAILIIIGWAIGYFGYHTGGLFHLILLVALIALLVQLFSGRKE
ncbi:lmo0937 family membrane protein [Fluviicola sp.]|uniref:lmo0937 family membrane protein n=1 Tax=Fluviicola sp. TaxID=1917219 RepID=UPI00261181A0|nr:lmo0937 family membrane protein [Fluviicola sp.]